jgi:acetyl-CoA synthetase
MPQRQELSALVTESRRFDPPAELAAEANVTAEAYDEAALDRIGFWEAQAQPL